jgi:hypothetical protein
MVTPTWIKLANGESGTFRVTGMVRKDEVVRGLDLNGLTRNDADDIAFTWAMRYGVPVRKILA